MLVVAARLNFEGSGWALGLKPRAGCLLEVTRPRLFVCGAFGVRCAFGGNAYRPSGGPASDKSPYTRK